MATAPPSDSTAKILAGRLAMLFGLTAMAVSQPLLSVFSNSPSTFVLYDFGSDDIIRWALALTFVPPLILWSIGVVISLIHRPTGTAVHNVMCGVLFALFVQQVVIQVGIDSSAIAWTISIASAITIVWALFRFTMATTWLQLTGILPFVALGLFVFSSPVSDLINPPAAAEPVAAVPSDEDSAPPSVLMIVLDELPTQSVITADEDIDAERFPNLAEFAGDATWYRHFTTLSPFTESAIPSMLTGVDPTEGDDPIWTNYPDNLFRLLGGSHHLTVAEAFTRLCGLETCTQVPNPPPSPADEPALLTDSPQESTPTADRDAMWEITRTLWSDRLDPDRTTGSPLDDFEEETEAVTVPTSSAPSTPDTLDPALTDELLLQRFGANQLESQPERYTEFFDALTASDDPTFYYLHLILPHQPWRYDRIGVEYRIPEGEAMPFDPSMNGDWLARLSRQRHLLQASYADELLGRLLERARDEGIYDDALVVVAADHGVAFDPGNHLREFAADTVPSIAYAPLLIKPPGQTIGSVDDANVSLVDMVPTIAEQLGADVPWETDGADMTSAEVVDRSSDKRYYDWTDAFDPELRGIVEYDDVEQFRSMTQDVFPPLDSSGDPLSGLWQTTSGGEELIGLAVDQLTVAPTEEIPIEVAEYSAILRPGDDEAPLGVITGFVPDEGISGDTSLIAVAVDGRIVSISEIEERNGRAGWFTAPLPTEHRPPIEPEILIVDSTSGVAARTTIAD